MTKTRIFDAVIRVSRVNGREGSSFMSPAEQREAIQRRADRDGVVIAEWWDETDSVSGGTVDREGLQAAIKRAVEGRTDGIFVAKVDRFSRAVQGGLSAITTLEDAGKELWSAREGVIVGDEKATATETLIRTFWLALAQWQRDTLTEGWESVRQRHIAHGIPNTEPYGYRKDATRHLVPVPDEAAHVVKIYELRSEGKSWFDIASSLNNRGIRTRAGVRWNVNSVRRIVLSRVYLGEITSGDFVNENAHDPIIKRKLWVKANGLNKTAEQRRTKAQYCLTGTIRCAGCGVRMAGGTSHSKYGSIRYYKCRRHHTFGECPAPARIRADVIEAMVDEVFRERFLSNRVAEPSASTEALDAALAALEDAEADLRDFLTSDATAEMKKVLGQSWVDEGQKARLARVVEARDTVAEARSAAFGVALPMDLPDVWDTLDNEERRSFLADAFEVVAIRRGGGVRIWTRNDPSTPRDLPTRGGVCHITPIVADYAPASPRKAAA